MSRASTAVAARLLGVSRSTLKRWRRSYRRWSIVTRGKSRRDFWITLNRVIGTEFRTSDEASAPSSSSHGNICFLDHCIDELGFEAADCGFPASVIYLRESPVTLSARTASTVGAAIKKYQSITLAITCMLDVGGKSHSCGMCETHDRFAWK